MADNPEQAEDFGSHQALAPDRPEEADPILQEPDEQNDGKNEDPTTQIKDALQKLPLFEDLFLGMQALNLDIVDGYLEHLETELLREYMEIERTPVQSAMFVSALSQLWVFGLYELLRTWRQRVGEVIKFGEELNSLVGSDREKRVAEQKERVVKASEAALDRMYYWEPFEAASKDDSFVDMLRDALDKTEMLFRRIEALRVSLAKHEVPKSKGVYAMAPGYGRIDMSDGSIYWQVVLQDNHVDLVSRRTLADECRRIAEDRLQLILPRNIQKLVSQLPREGYGITRIAVKLEDGTEYEQVLVGWSRQLLWVKGGKAFDARKVVDVRHVPPPPDIEEPRMRLEDEIQD
jgi:hypothetical protein